MKWKRQISNAKQQTKSAVEKKSRQEAGKRNTRTRRRRMGEEAKSHPNFTNVPSIKQMSSLEQNKSKTITKQDTSRARRGRG